MPQRQVSFPWTGWGFTWDEAVLHLSSILLCPVWDMHCTHRYIHVCRARQSTQAPWREERESSVDIEGFLFGMPTKWGQAYPAASLLSSALRCWGVRSGSEYSGRCDSAPWGTGRHRGLPGPPCPRGHCCWGLPSGYLLLCQGPWLPGPRDSQELSVSQPWFCRCPCLPTVLAEIGCSPILVFCNDKEFRTETGSSGQPGGKAE